MQKTLWVLFLVFLPFLAVFIYLIVRGRGMGERAGAQQQFEGYVRNVAATGEATPTEQIARAKELLDAGAAPLRDRLMQRPWQKPLAMSGSWPPTSTTRPSAMATMMGSAHGPSSADALHQEAND